MHARQNERGLCRRVEAVAARGLQVRRRLVRVRLRVRVRVRVKIRVRVGVRVRVRAVSSVHRGDLLRKYGRVVTSPPRLVARPTPW